MKLRSITIENVRSFLDPQTLEIPGDLGIIVGPNGGGKTNLLDTISTAIRKHLLKSWIPRHNPIPEWQERYDWIENDRVNAGQLEKHSAAKDKTQRVVIELEMTSADVESIKKAKSQAVALSARSKSKYVSYPAEIAAQWKTDGLVPGSKFKYSIIDNSMPVPSDGPAGIFLSFLSVYEIEALLRSEHAAAPLSMPMISLPVNRTAGGLRTSVALGDFNETESKKSVDAASSKSAPSICELAIGRLAARYRMLLEDNNRSAKEVFYRDPSIVSFSKTLTSLGYGWELECLNPTKNLYDIKLSKQGASFFVSAASSGERELLIYLFAIYALNVRDALILIDEPELHLHPRWQRILLGLFRDLARETGNQFVMATHSPMFISPESIQYVSRVFSESQKSVIVKPSADVLPKGKHLINVVNSQNNEKMFFCDKVILVEGISDRLFVEALLRSVRPSGGGSRIIEVVGVGGKKMFSQYESALSACKIPYSIVADLDYVNDIGTDEIKGLFVVNSADLVKKTIDDPSSIDGASLAARLDEAIRSQKVEDLSAVWEYVKARQRRLSLSLSDKQKTLLTDFIHEQRKKGICILSLGAIEEYMPTGYKGKDIDKVIELTSDENFWTRVPDGVKSELQTIVEILHS